VGLGVASGLGEGVGSGTGSRVGTGSRAGTGTGWVVFQKNVCVGCLLDPGGGGLPNPTESTMWGEGSPGSHPAQAQSATESSHGRRGRTSCSVPTGADGVTRGLSAQ